MRSLRSKFGRAFGVSQARAAYAVLYDVMKNYFFADRRKFNQDKFIF